MKMLISSLALLAGATATARTTAPIETKEAIVKVPVRYTIEEMEVACVIEFIEDSDPYLYFSPKDYRRERELSDAGLRSKIVEEGNRCREGTALTYVEVPPYTKASEIDNTIRESGGYKSTNILFYSHKDSQTFAQSFYQTMQDMLKDETNNQ